MRIEGGGTGRLQQPRPQRVASSVADLRERMRSASRQAMAEAKAAEAHVRRLGTGRLMGAEKLPWENASGRIKSTQEHLERTSKAIKAGRLIYKGLSESQRFVAVASKVGNSRAAKAVTDTGRRVLDMTDKATHGKSAKLVEKAGKVAEFGKAYVKGELVEHVTDNVAKSVTKSFEKKAVAKATAVVGGKVAAKTAAKTGAAVAGKAAGRFVPGANVAIAAYDVYKAAKTLSDPKASGWKKGTAVATAAFSVVAATNIPVVSQVAAGLSVATDLASNLKPSAIADGAKKAASKVKNFISGL